MNSIIIPAYNEEENLPFLLDDLLSLKLKDTEIIIVNDNSKDKTPEIAERYSKKYKNISVINRTKGNNGMGFALVEGTKKAKGEIIVWLMADRCDNLETIPRMINKIKSGNVNDIEVEYTLRIVLEKYLTCFWYYKNSRKDIAKKNA